MRIERNVHAIYYHDAAYEISGNPDWFDECTPEQVAQMKAANTIWSIQMYPNTPVGFNNWCAATLDEAIDAARKEG